MIAANLSPFGAVDAETAFPAAVVSNALDAVTEKLTWATEQLKQSHNCAESSIQLCRLVRECADAALSLKRLQTPRR